MHVPLIVAGVVPEAVAVVQIVRQKGGVSPLSIILFVLGAGLEVAGAVW